MQCHMNWAQLELKFQEQNELFMTTFTGLDANRCMVIVVYVCFSTNLVCGCIVEESPHSDNTSHRPSTLPHDHTALTDSNVKGLCACGDG